MATHSSILAWRIPWTQESSRLQSIGLDMTEQLTLSLSFPNCQSVQSCISLSPIPDTGKTPGERRKAERHELQVTQGPSSGSTVCGHQETQGEV